MHEQSMLAEAIECSGCGEQIKDGSSIFILCPLCAIALLDIPDPNQLILFELPATPDIL